jgi:hypothetical protein
MPLKLVNGSNKEQRYEKRLNYLIETSEELFFGLPFMNCKDENELNAFVGRIMLEIISANIDDKKERTRFLDRMVEEVYLLKGVNDAIKTRS